MNRMTTLTAALLGIVLASPVSAAEDIAMPASCYVKANSIEAQLATSRLARIHEKARNYSPRFTHQLELSAAASFPWRLADGGAWRDAASSAVCTRCER
jgi:hypothetical protein